MHALEGSTCEMNRRGFALKGIMASGVSVMGNSLTSEPVQGQFFTIRAIIQLVLVS